MPDWSRARILAEGGDDAHFLKHFIELKCGATVNVNEQIVNCKDVGRLLEQIKARLGESIPAIAVVCDADEDPHRRWQELREHAPGLQIPEEPSADGTIVEFGEGRRLGIWMMPDNTSPGQMEDFLRKIRSEAPPQPTLWQKALTAVSGLEESERLFKIEDQIKAEVRTWLAWQEEPGASPGLAVTMDCFDIKHPLAERLAAWLSKTTGSDVE